jgi:hypothetical protein
MPNTYTLLETITVGAAGASSVTFNSIPQTGYTDLVIHASMRDDSTGSNANGNATIVFNGDTANGTYRELFGTGSAAGSGTDTKVKVNYQTASGSGSTASTFGSAQIYIPNYRNANFKSVSTEGVAESNTAGMFMTMGASLWSSTAAITSIKINPGNGNFVQYSTFSLYGVSALGTTPTKAPKATGGSIIQTDGTYWYHAFLSSGTFTPATALSCDVLVVAGGGSGGYSNNIYNTGGGGGAGGVVYLTSQSIAASAQTVTVGAGASATVSGLQGNNSVFGSLTAAVGGGAGGNYGNGGSTGGNGGSGGGAVGLGPYTGGTATSGQGNAGGSTGSNRTGSGGGGAGAVGQDAPAQPNGGNGGAGTNTYSTQLAVVGLGVSGYIAGGGGGGNSPAYGGATGGVGGSGGGGTSSPTSGAIGGAGTANTGSGGAAGTGNGAQPYYGGNGGSGLVIIRYPIA